MNKKIIPLFFTAVMFFFSGYASTNDISSPNGKIHLKFWTDKRGIPYYSVSSVNKPLMAESIMGLEARQLNLESDFIIAGVSRGKKDEVWHQPWGENKTIREHYNEMAVALTNSAGIKLTIRFRVFDDGLGFRYEYKVSKVDSVFVTDEQTQFNIAEDGISWSTRANFDTYEMLYTEKAISEMKDASTPVTFKTRSGLYASIHEAALYDFPEMALVHESGTRFKANLAPWPDGMKAKMGNSFSTPWRTIQIGEKAIDLINSSLILNLNEPCAIKNTDWIKPMKYVGIWWGMHVGVQSWSMGDRHGATTENTKKYIDFAHDNNIQGVLVEGWNKGWETWGGRQNFNFTEPYEDFDIKELSRYAKQRGVEIIGHHETGGNIYNYERQLDSAFKWYKSLGIDNVKTGYAGGMPDGQVHQGQFGVRHFQKVVETAARYGITINGHEIIKDTGIRRTWPNMMSRECARGMEWNGWSAGNPPSHYEILPFTRLLSGPFDYTPGTFDVLLENTKKSPNRKLWQANDDGNDRVSTTLANQIADWVILYSPVQMASDMIENYQGHPAFQFFRDFDADCDKSRALAGEPGQFIVVVREAKGKFFLGATTNESARTVRVKLDFLPKGKKYQAIIYADGDRADWKTSPTDYKITKKIVGFADVLNIVMAKGGGQAISFMEAK